MSQNNNPQTPTKPESQKSRWDGYIHEIEIYGGLPESLYHYKVEDMQMLLYALTRGGHPKILYIEYDYGGDDYDEGEHFVELVDPEFKAFLEKKGKISSTGKVKSIKEADVKEFLKLKEALSLYIVDIEDGEDAATVVAYV